MTSTVDDKQGHPLVLVSDLTVEFGVGSQAHRAVRAVDLTISHGESLGLIGESGCGKSTLALALLGLTTGGGRIVAGSVQYEGRELLGLSERDWLGFRGRKIGLITQHPRGAFNPMKRVGEQITSFLRLHSGSTKEQARGRTLEMLERVGWNDPVRGAQSFPHELSGGMAQRALIALALAPGPEVLIADEPTTALGMALVIVSHDMGVIANYCETVYVMNAGEIVDRAASADLFSGPGHLNCPAALGAAAEPRRGVIRAKSPPRTPGTNETTEAAEE